MYKDYTLQILTSAVVSSLLTGLLLWLTKSWISERLKNAIKNEYDEKLETHKAQLKAQSDVEIEKLRSQLNITATEHEVRFSRLHEKRAEVIAETYSLLQELFTRLAYYVKFYEPAGDMPKAERRKAAAEAALKFRDYYTHKLIFFPKATADKLEDIDRQLVIAYNEFFFDVEIPQGRDTIDKWKEIFNRVKGTIQEALRELEDEFRRLLGDESASPAEKHEP
jgi:hypothetical protein